MSWAGLDDRATGGGHRVTEAALPRGIHRGRGRATYNPPSMKRTSAGAVFLTVVVDLIGFGIVLPLLPLYATDFRADRFELGALMASFSAMQFLFAPVWGRISDRVGRRPVLLIGLAGSVVFYTLFGFADSVPMLFFAR